MWEISLHGGRRYHLDKGIKLKTRFVWQLIACWTVPCYNHSVAMAPISKYQHFRVEYMHMKSSVNLGYNIHYTLHV